VIQKIVYEAADIGVMLGVSKGTVWRMNAAGQLPKSFKLTPAQTVWDMAMMNATETNPKLGEFMHDACNEMFGGVCPLRFALPSRSVRGPATETIQII